MGWKQVFLPGGGSGGSRGFRDTIKSGLKLTQRFIIRSSVDPALKLTHRFAVRNPVGIGIGLHHSVQANMLDRQDVGILLDERFAVRTEQKPGFKIVQETIATNWRPGSNAATEEAYLGRTDFDTPANAQAKNNGTLCSCPSNSLGARSGKLRLNYPDPVNKSELNITSVKLYFYISVTKPTLTAVTAIGGYNIGSGDVVLQTWIATMNGLTNPVVFDLTSVVTSWALIAAFNSYVTAEHPAGLLGNVRVDAIELEVIASRTWS